jgi:hypothetical protein
MRSETAKAYIERMNERARKRELRKIPGGKYNTIPVEQTGTSGQRRAARLKAKAEDEIQRAQEHEDLDAKEGDDGY